MNSASESSLSPSSPDPMSGDHDAGQSILKSTNRLPEMGLENAATSNADDDERNGITIGEPNDDRRDDDGSCDFVDVECHEATTANDTTNDQT